MGDDEFFGVSSPLNVEEIKWFSGVVKIIAFNMHWNTLPEGFMCETAISTFATRDLLTRILGQIYDRDSRCPFCPEAHWLVENDDMNSYIDMVPSQADLESATGRVSTCQTILRTIPFIIPFERRVKLFRSYVAFDQQGISGTADWHQPVARVNIRRGRVFEDGFTTLNALKEKMKKKIAISFIDEHGLPEAGIDGGGVFKEFMTS
jgi:ubiquitin-protein ligase E3 C